MSLRIAFDLDGVLADMESALVRQAVVLFGEGVMRDLPDCAGQSAAPAIAGGGAPDDRTAEANSLDDGAADDVPARLDVSARQERRLWRHVKAIENFWETLDKCEPGTWPDRDGSGLGYGVRARRLSVPADGCRYCCENLPVDKIREVSPADPLEPQCPVP